MQQSGQVSRNTCICVGVCTYRRAKMLQRCLASLKGLEQPQGSDLRIIVVENNDEQTEAETVNSLPSTSERRFHYVHEKRRGIAQARNAVLDFAQTVDADWIVMLDDDQTVPSDWLINMMDAQRVTGADIIKSAVIFDYPSPMPLWAFPRKESVQWRYDRNFAGTNGVLFTAKLAKAGAGGLRFREEFGLTSGEDRDFFTRARLAGHRIVETPEAIATEFLPESKLTFGAQIRRVFAQEVVNVRQDYEHVGFYKTLFSKLSKVIELLASGSLLLLASPFAYVGSRAYGRFQLLTGCQRFTKAAAMCVGLSNRWHSEPYRQAVHGE